MKLGEKIKLLRTKAEMTQPDLADAAGIEQSYLSKLENDKSVPSYDILVKILDAFQVSLEEMLKDLDEVYVREHLMQISEVAAFFELSSYKDEQQRKRGIMTGGLVMILGISMLLMGLVRFPFNERAYNYSSKGILKSGETVWYFHGHKPRGESRKEYDARMQEIIERFDEKFLLSYEYKGDSFIVRVLDGRRLYELGSGGEIDVDRWQNNALIVLGIVILCVGGLILALNSHGRRYRKK